MCTWCIPINCMEYQLTIGWPEGRVGERLLDLRDRSGGGEGGVGIVGIVGPGRAAQIVASC